jgi:ribosomal protein L11 methyltransferase
MAEDGIEGEVSVRGVSEADWINNWKKYYKPLHLGRHPVIVPKWEDYNPAEGETVVRMDPGMAFGSGLHETTSMCIKALEKYMTPGARVLDVGTGTGILAIAAALLGAGGCLGIDIDSEAVRVASENTAKNGFCDAIAIVKGDLTEGVNYDADIIVANLMADLVIRLSPAAAKHLGPGGIYISSGILDIKEDAAAEAVREAGFDILEIMSDGEWRAIAAVRR